MKKLFAGLISLAAALLAVCAITVCAGAEWSGDYEYSVLDDGTVEITDYTGSATNLTIPATIGGKKVTSLGNSSFYECKSLISVIIPDSVTSIGGSAFFGCSNLTSISLPKGVTNIVNWTFAYCKSLTSISIPSSVTNISECAFIFSNITAISLTDSLINISDRAFCDCDGIKNVYYTGSEDQWKSISVGEDNSYLLNADITYNYKPDTVTGLKLKSSSADTIKLSWDRQELTDGYIVELWDGDKWSVIKNINNNITTEYQITGLESSTTYNCRIKTYKTSSVSDIYSEYSAITVCTNPISVGGLKLKARTADAVRLTWDMNTSADGYIVEIKVNNLWEYLEKITDNSIIEFRKGGLNAGAEYSFRVKAYKMSGNTAYYSEYSTINVCTNPTSITGLKVKARAADAVRLTWDKNTSADGYIVEMNVNGTWKRAAKIENNSIAEYKKGGLAPSTVYNFRVKTYKMSGNTATYSATKSISVRTNPTAISGLKASYKTATTVDLTWDTNYSADGYIIERQNGASWTRVKKITNEYSSYCTLNGLKPKTSYKFRIKAYKMSGSTALYSATKTISVSTTAAVNVNSVSLNRTSATMYVSDTLQLSSTINPFNASYTTVKYTSSNPKVVSVSSNGLVRALSSGTATITASCGGKKATCKITVKNYSGVRGNYAVMKAYIDKNGKTNDDGNKYVTYSYSADGYDWTMKITHNYSTNQIDVYISTGTNKSANFSIDYSTDELFIYVKGTVQGSHMSLGRDPQGNYSYSFSSSNYSGRANRIMMFLDNTPSFYIHDLVYNSSDVNYSKAYDLVSYTAESAYLAFLDFAYSTFRFTAKDLGFGVI